MIAELKRKLSAPFSGEADRGVSPVIGVILMVAITVILAAVIGAFVLGLGEGLGSGSGPQAQFSFSEGSGAGEIDISHRGGDVVDLSEITVLIDGSADDGVFGTGGEIQTGESDTFTVNGTASGNVEIEFRHDPSDSIIASGTGTVGSA